MYCPPAKFGDDTSSVFRALRYTHKHIMYRADERPIARLIKRSTEWQRRDTRRRLYEKWEYSYCVEVSTESVLLACSLQSAIGNDCMELLHDVNPGIARINDVVSNRQRRLADATSFIVALAAALFTTGASCADCQVISRTSSGGD